MQKLLYLIILTGCIGLSAGALPQLSDSSIVRNAVKEKLKGIALWKQKSFDSALIVTEKALELSKHDNDSLVIAQCLNNIGLIYNSKGDPIKSFLYYNQALDIIKAGNHPEEKAKALLNLGIAYKEQAIYDQALSYLFESIALLQTLNDKKSEASAYNTIGNVMMLDNNYENALQYHLQALHIRRDIGYTEGIAGSLNNIGMVYQGMSQLDSALSYFKASLDLKEKEQPNEQTANTYSHIAEIYMVGADYRTAHNYYEKALAIRKLLQHKKGLAISYFELGTLFFSKKNYPTAESFLIKAIKEAKGVNAIDVQLKCYEQLRKLYRKTGNSLKALIYDDLYFELNEKILGRERKKALVQLQIKYETQKKQREIASLNQEKQKQQAIVNAQIAELRVKTQANTWLTIVGCLFLALLLLTFFFYRSKKREAIRAKHDADHIQVLMKESHHREKNNLQIIASILSLQSESLVDITAQEAAKSSGQRVQAIMFIHEQLYTENTPAEINMAEYLNKLVDSLALAYTLEDYPVKTTLIVKENLILPVDQAKPIALITNEWICNAFKHAFHHRPDQPQITVSLTHHNEKQLLLMVRDNGNGPELNTESRGLGLKLANILVKQLNGSLTKVRDKEGFGYELLFPKERPSV